MYCEKSNQLFRELPAIKLPFNKQVTYKGYTFHTMDYIGRYIVDIRRPEKDNLYITLGLKYKGNFWEEGENVCILGYYLVGTNGCFEDCQEAKNIIYDYMINNQ